jgi:hypothetical protein
MEQRDLHAGIKCFNHQQDIAMNKLKSLPVAAILVLLSSAVWAATDSETQSPSEMPMMNQEQNGMMMSPEMMQERMPSEQYHNSSMMNHGQNGMMNPQMMHMMMQGMGEMGNGHGHGYGQGQNCDMPMKHQGDEGRMEHQGNEGMMNPQMRQMRMQQMTNMEQHLQNIESLLSQLVELQKAK